MWDSMREPLIRSIEHAQRADNKSIERDVLGMVLGNDSLRKHARRGGHRRDTRDP